MKGRKDESSCRRSDTPRAKGLANFSVFKDELLDALSEDVLLSHQSVSNYNVVSFDSQTRKPENHT